MSSTKAVVIAKEYVSAEINSKATYKRHEQGWVDEVYDDLDNLLDRAIVAKENKEAVSLAYNGNIVDLWERIVERNISIDIGSDQTSLHNPWAEAITCRSKLEESNKLMSENPEKFKLLVKKTLIRHTEAGK